MTCQPLSRLVTDYCVDSFFFIDTAPTEIYTLSLHDALPIFRSATTAAASAPVAEGDYKVQSGDTLTKIADRKSTRLNSSHRCISYAVFCLKKKKIKQKHQLQVQRVHLKRL